MLWFAIGGGIAALLVALLYIFSVRRFYDEPVREETPPPDECCRVRKPVPSPEPSLVTAVSRPSSGCGCRCEATIVDEVTVADVIEAEIIGEAIADAVITVVDAVVNSTAEEPTGEYPPVPSEEPLPAPDYAPTPCESFDGSRYEPAPEPVAEVSGSFSYDPPAYDPPSYDPPAPEPSSYDSGGSSYDSGGYDSGSSDYGSSDYGSSSDCGGDW